MGKRWKSGARKNRNPKPRPRGKAGLPALHKRFKLSPQMRVQAEELYRQTLARHAKAREAQELNKHRAAALERQAETRQKRDRVYNDAMEALREALQLHKLSLRRSLTPTEKARLDFLLGPKR